MNIQRPDTNGWQFGRVSACRSPRAHGRRTAASGCAGIGAQVVVGPGRAHLAIEAGLGGSPYQPSPKPSPLVADRALQRADALLDQRMGRRGDIPFEGDGLTSIGNPAAHGRSSVLRPARFKELCDRFPKAMLPQLARKGVAFQAPRPIGKFTMRGAGLPPPHGSLLIPSPALAGEGWKPKAAGGALDVVLGRRRVTPTRRHNALQGRD